MSEQRISKTSISHTPGPWVAASHPSSIVGWPVVAKSGGRAIASVHVRLGTDEAVAGANARLIAAAPDLLEACRAAKDFLVHDLEEPGRTVFWQLVAAIDKAGGTSRFVNIEATQP